VKEKIVVYGKNHIEHMINLAGKTQSFLMLNPLEHVTKNGL
jgi:hypothetical protein